MERVMNGIALRLELRTGGDPIASANIRTSAVSEAP
jgi:hypothetical protein